MFNINPWIIAARPKTLFAICSPIIVALTLSDIIYNQVNWSVVTLTVFSAALLQIGSNYANDAYDFINGADKINRVGPKRMAQEGVLEPNTILNMMYFIFTISVLIGFYLAKVGGWPIVIVGLLCILFAIIYTGGPYPLAYNALGDVTVFIFFGLVATLGSFYLQNPSPEHFFKHIEIICLAAAAVGFLNTSILVVNNVRDYKTDKESNKKTLVVLFGQKFGCYEYLLLICLSYICFGLISFLLKNYWIFLAVILILPSYLIQTVKIFSYNESNLNKVLEKTAKLSFLTSVLFYFSTFI
ncbi:MAG: hypothetical protein CBD97_01530 [Pelagibacteraceae bacterium TMED237]|nr:1,4-dihydroxy-2-naphthoate octaprenyltransferase [Candidatus Neomarinimicrobiota bacterium]OUW96309.1 MAG: hypothetical protein CBD97_01530 [Pelagibacteraceae bacterium TMED237]